MASALKYVLEWLATPLVLSLLLAVTAVAFNLCHRRHFAMWLLGVSALIGYVGSLTFVGDALLGPLEHRYQPLRYYQGSRHVSAIVVLGSGYAPRDSIPVTGALDEDGLARLVEGVRLTRAIPGARLVLSGGAPGGFSAPALGYAELAQELGVPEKLMTVLVQGRDTKHEAFAIRGLLGGVPFVLVTSAYHMPRAMRLMQRIGLHPIPAPTAQLAGIPAVEAWARVLPNARGLRETERALHEYLGLAALALDLN
jgi:uncharacterized SAM-binding protein YcdF (DUF218 family)